MNALRNEPGAPEARVTVLKSNRLKVILIAPLSVEVIFFVLFACFPSTNSIMRATEKVGEVPLETSEGPHCVDKGYLQISGCGLAETLQGEEPKTA